MKKKSPWLLGLMMVVLFIQRLPSLFVPIWTKDEGFWWAVGKSVAVNKGTLFVDGADNKPAFFLYAYAGAIRFFGDHAFFALHFAVIVGQGLILYLIYRMATEYWGEKIGLATAFCYLVLQGSFVSQEILAANSENLMMPWLMGAFYLYVHTVKKTTNSHPERSEGSPEYYLREILRYTQNDRTRNFVVPVIIGLITGIAFHFRQTAIILFPIFFIHGLIIHRPWKFFLKPFLQDGILVALGFSIVMGLVSLHFYQLNTHADYWFWTTTLSRLYVGEPLSLKIILWDAFWKTGTIMLSQGLVWYLALQAICVRSSPSLDGRELEGGWPQDHPHPNPLPSRERGLLITFFLGMALTIIVGWRFSHHYYLQIFPAVALLAGEMMAQREKSGKNIWPLSKTWVLICLLVPFFGFTAEAYYRWARDAEGFPRPAIRHMGLWLRDHKQAHQSLFIWGYYPEIYFYSGLKNASRFVEIHFLTGQIRDSIQHGGLTSSEKILWQWLWEDLNKKQPDWILDNTSFPVSGRFLHPLSYYPELESFVEKNYVEVNPIEGMRIYRRR